MALMDELADLWEGVMTWDSHRKEWFKLRAVLLSGMADQRGYPKLFCRHAEGDPRAS